MQLSRIVALIALVVSSSLPAQPSGTRLLAVDGFGFSRLVDIDPDTGRTQVVGRLKPSLSARRIAWDARHRVLYGAQGNVSNNLLAIDSITGRVRIIGHFSVGSSTSTSTSPVMHGLEYDHRSGTLYGVTSSYPFALYRIDVHTARCSVVGNPTVGLDGLALDAANGVIYASSKPRGTLYQIDLTTGLEVFVGRFNAPEVGDGLAYDPKRGACFSADDGYGGCFCSGNLLFRINTTTGRAFHVGQTAATSLSGFAFVTLGAIAYGTSSPGCDGPLEIGAPVGQEPRIGNAGFSVICDNAPKPGLGAGILALSTGRLSTPLAILGVDVWIAPVAPIGVLAATGNAAGVADVPLPIPAVPSIVGNAVFAQFLWVGPSSPPPCPPLGWSASNALQITIQP